MNQQLTIEQRFALTRARYEVSRMSRPALEKTALRLLKTRMQQKNGIQQVLLASGILFRVDEQQGPLDTVLLPLASKIISSAVEKIPDNEELGETLINITITILNKAVKMTKTDMDDKLLLTVINSIKSR